ncbi:AUGMIN subunit 1-like isoform X2 [Magnolia sinica]|uniref:AUGMIN subunit 1-like isoform X2 n=1 Tax=Magnolia sinica TaxID=86752 RepID=UPI002657C9CF|nr:AUGMIN subunit 1-like isoform X2 [Magnolia sinica]
MARFAVRRGGEGRPRVRVHAAEHRASPRACNSLPSQDAGGRDRRVGPPPEGRGVSLPRTFQKLDDEVASCEAQMHHWKTNLAIMVSKERQYNQQYSNYKALLNRVGYTPEISHGVLVDTAEHKKELEKKTKPILDTLRSYQDLPPDKALAALAIEEKRRQYRAAEKCLEDVLQSALATTE